VRSSPRRILGTGLVAAALLVSACGADAPDAGGDPRARGEKVFAANCASCHGPSREGTTAGPPLTGATVTATRIEQAVTKGIDDNPDWPAMPPLISIGQTDRDALVAYLTR
jgi:ubiquinol-cytochrome c reductase cytochrome c subunit